MGGKHEEVATEQVGSWIGLESAKLNSIAKACLRSELLISAAIGAVSDQIQIGARRPRRNDLKCCDEIFHTLAGVKAAYKDYRRSLQDFSRRGGGA